MRSREKEYLSKCSIIHLQVKFNSLKQKNEETAHDFRRRVDVLAMEFYEFMVKEQTYNLEQQQTIMEVINYRPCTISNLVPNKDIKLIVRSQKYLTIIVRDSAEEKVRGPTNKHIL